MIDSIEIESEGVSFFNIVAVQGQGERSYRLERANEGGEWRLSWPDNYGAGWIASGKVKWPDALARALKLIDAELRKDD